MPFTAAKASHFRSGDHVISWISPSESGTGIDVRTRNGDSSTISRREGFRCADTAVRLSGPASNGEKSGSTSRGEPPVLRIDRKSTRLNSSHGYISYAVFCLKKKKNNQIVAHAGT